MSCQRLSGVLKGGGGGARVGSGDISSVFLTVNLAADIFWPFRARFFASRCTMLYVDHVFGITLGNKEYKMSLKITCFLFRNKICILVLIHIGIINCLSVEK